MGMIKEPKNVTFSIQSEPWTEAELSDFRKLMKAIKQKNAAKSKSARVLKPKSDKPLGS